MKRILAILAFLPLLALWHSPGFVVQNYYFANSGTDGGACSIASPCKTITYLNTLSLVPGDTVFFNRGNIFNDTTLRITHSGSSSLKIVYTYYGTGAAPIISGFYKLVGYTNVSGNIYTVPCLRCRNSTNEVTYDGHQQWKDRTPNSGYFTNSKASGTTYITDSVDLTGTPNYTGAQLVLRNNHYTMTVNTITSQSGDTLNYTTAGGIGTSNGWGYFIQGLHNDIMLDTAGEWWYDSTTNLMHIYTPDTTKTVNVGVIDTLVDMANTHVQYISFIGLTFQGANNTIFQLVTNNTIISKNCNFIYSNKGCVGSNQTNGQLIKDTIAYLNDYAYSISSSTGGIIDSNYIHDIGMQPGMGVPTSAYNGLSVISTGAEINWNTIFNIGYDAIFYKGATDTINYNLIHNFCNLLDDGAGVYSDETSGQTWAGRRIVGNMIYNGIGAPLGTVGGIAGETGAVGVYTDQNNTNIQIDSNSIFACSQAGVYVHASQGISIENNNIFGNGWVQIQFNRDNGSYPLLRFDTVKNNVMGAPGTSTQYTGTIWALTTLDANYDSVGDIDSNNYVATSPRWYVGTSTGATSLNTYSQWGVSTGTDLHSAVIPASPILLYDSLTTPVNYFLSSGYTSATGAYYIGNVTLQPTTSLVLWPVHYPIAYGQGEYMRPGIRDDHRAFILTNTTALMGTGGTGTLGKPNLITSTAYMVFTISNLHNAAWLDSAGNPWFVGQQCGIPWLTGSSSYEGNTDSLAGVHTFSMLATGWQAADGNYSWYAGIAKADSSLWICGDIQHGLRGIHGAAGSTSSYWVQIPTGGKKVKSIMGDWNLIILYWDGSASTLGNSGSYQSSLGWGTPSFGQSAGSYSSNYDSPHDLGLSHIRMISGGHDLNWAIDSTGIIYGWGIYGWRMGHTTSVGEDPLNTPTVLTTEIVGAGKMPGTPDTVVTDGACTHFKYAGTVWGIGSNDQGTIGNGQQVNFATYNVAPGSPYNDGGANEATGTLVQFTIQQIMVGKSNITTLYNGGYYNYFDLALDANGNFVIWGRNKGGVGSVRTTPIDTASELIQGVQPNGWQRPWPTMETNPFTLVTVDRSTSQGCYNACTSGPVTGSPCSLVTPTCYTDHAALSATSSGTTVYLNASSSTSTGDLVYATFSQTAGTATSMGVTDNPVSYTDTITGVAPGTYTYKVVVQDPNWGADSVTQSITVGQTGYYFAAAGSDANACTLAAPCQTIAKFNTVYSSLSGGDTVYFNRGDAFIGEMNVTVSGSAGHPIVVTPYGSGADPVIGGALTLSGWTNVSGNIWSVAYSGPWINWASQNGALMTQARTPNLTTGYFIASAMTTGTITDAAHASLVTIGTKIIIRSSAFTIDTARVTGVAGSVISFSPSATYANVGGMGWAIFNNTPDSTGEIQDTLGSLRVFSVGSPSATYKIAASDTALIDNGTYHEWDSLHFTGSNFVNVVLPFNVSANISFKGCINDYSVDGYQYRSEGGVSVIGGFVQHMTNNGKLKLNLNNFNNYDSAITVYDIGMTPGMGRPGTSQPSYTGWIGGDSGSTVVNLFIDSVGYCGVVTYGSGFNVNYNLIKYWCQILEDGGAVYTWVSSGTAFARQRNIIGNICLNGGGTYSHNGDILDYSSAANGIYLDAFSSNVLVKNNGVYNVNSCAYYDHGASNTFNGNISLNAAYSQFYVFEYTGGPTISGLSIKNSVLGFVPIGAYSIKIYTVNNDLTTFGVIDSNYYLVPVSITSTLYTKSSVDAGTARTLASWQSNTGYDTHTQYLQYAPLQFVYSIAGGSQSVYGINMDVLGNIYNGAITLTAYQSKILQTLSLPQLNSLKGGKIKFK